MPDVRLAKRATVVFLNYGYSFAIAFNRFDIPKHNCPQSYLRGTLRHMRTFKFAGIVTAVCVAAFALSAFAKSNDDVKIVKKAVERSTLNQRGTKPFHMKAILAPSLKRDSNSGRTGEVEIWWSSPTEYRREVRSPSFHQIEIVNANYDWQKSEGDYFPEWLREIAVALIEPVPSLNQVLDQVKGADVRKLMGVTNFSWNIMSTDGIVQTSVGAGVEVTDSTGLLIGGSGLGWSGGYRDYEDFHGRAVARTVTSGTPEVTGKVVTLEDLKNIPTDLFEADASGGDSSLLRTIVLDETSLRKNLQPTEPIVWPILHDAPFEGALSAEISVDRAGRVREIGSIVGSNRDVYDAARTAIAAMRFTPFTRDGSPVQVVSRISMGFKSGRPAGAEAFAAASDYFERARHLSFPAAAAGPGYELRATFTAALSARSTSDGQYTDTWQSDSEWRREATIGKSRYVRSRHGEKRYELAEGPDAPLLRLVFRALEPIPATDTFVESDWKITRDPIGGAPAIRVLTGYVSPEGVFDPQHVRAFWFDETGKLLQSYSNGFEIHRENFADFGGASVAREIKVSKNGSVAILINVIQVSPAANIPNKLFEIRGHERTRSFTDEVR